MPEAARHRVLIAIPASETQSVCSALLALAPSLEVALWPEVRGDFQADCLLVWAPTSEQLAAIAPGGFIQAYGAGVEKILAHPDMRADIPVARLVHPAMTAGMSQYVVHAVLDRFRLAAEYRRSQQDAAWRRLPHPDARTCTVGILGPGAMGSHLAGVLASLGFPVRVWGRSPRRIEGAEGFWGVAALPAFLSGSSVLVCMLPLTPETRGLLDARRLDMLPAGAYLINCSRGAILNEEALLAALASERLSGATLDVFAVEPLPAESPLWRHPRIRLTPHIATFPHADFVAEQIVDNLRRLERGERLANLVDFKAGY